MEQWVRMLVFLILMPMVTLTEESSLPLCYWKNKGFTENGFQKVACAKCYAYMHTSNFVPGRKARLVEATLLNVGNITVEANFTLPHRQLIQTFSSESAVDKWTECCIKAAQCCTDMTNNVNIANGSDWCPWTWDGWLCWPQTPPGSTAQRPCPSFIRFGTTEHNCDCKVH
ncbi:hypothetical protein L9F63_003258 [Diploptera punctata]|uniref:G-protein coupled receptors family 2 profile 1 domain-containing protein n=1 Tax=Diploptera punctata TaxID=6984 RepID=A0AAD7ZL45_DIPPU|nr:hypothetical protein L9F63_003258 [Diploptera punctata]